MYLTLICSKKYETANRNINFSLSPLKQARITFFQNVSHVIYAFIHVSYKINYKMAVDFFVGFRRNKNAWSEKHNDVV
jgi:hypothetical protein